MRLRALAALIVAVLLAVASPLMVGAMTGEETHGPTKGELRLVRTIKAGDIDLLRPNGLAYSPESQSLIISGTAADRSLVLRSITLLEKPLAELPLPAGVPSSPNVAYDPPTDQLVSAASTSVLLNVPVVAGKLTSGARGSAASVLGGSTAEHAAGLAVNAAGEKLVLDTAAKVSVVSAGKGASRVTRNLSLASAGEGLRGLATAPTGHLFSVGTATRTLYEFTSTGTLLVKRDLNELNVRSPQGLVVAPTADTSDAPSLTSLYLADAGATDGTGAGILEIAFSEPVLSQAALLAPQGSVTLVKTVNTGAGSTLNPDSPDPSGLAYINDPDVPPAWRGLVIADGEVEEVTGAGFHGANVWFAPTNGGAQTATFDTTVAPTTPLNKEPVGAAYDPVRNQLYIVHDGGGGRVWVYNAVTMDQVRSFDVTVAPYNDADAEGLAFANGVLYMVDAIDNDLVKVLPGPDGVVGTGNDDVVTNYDLEQYGQTEPEGLDVHPDTGNIWIVSNRLSRTQGPDPMIEVTPTGQLVHSYSIAAANPNSAAGLAIAPPSMGGAGWNIYVSDRMIDNGQDPNENDGRIYEFSVPGGSGNTVPSASPVSVSTPQNTPANVTLAGSDVETCELTFSIVGTPTHGTLGSIGGNVCASGSPNNDTASVQYTPTTGYTGYTGSDSFTYQVSDGTDSSAATVTITVVGGSGGTIALRAAVSGANARTTTLVLPRPTGTAAGDVVLAAVSVRATPTITAPSGWSLVRRDSRGTAFTQAVYVHVAGGSEPATYTFKFNSSQTAVGTIAAYSGVDNASPIAGNSGQANKSSAAITAPSITTPVSNTELVGFFAIAGKTTIGTAAGMAERTEVVTPSAPSKLTASLDDQAIPASGATGARTATAAKSANNIGQLVALRPAP